jgi:hypothetical protein
MNYIRSINIYINYIYLFIVIVNIVIILLGGSSHLVNRFYPWFC